MEKMIKFEFFKRLGFPTKMDGIAFVETIPDLQKKMNKIGQSIEEYKNDKMDEFEEYFEKYNKEKKMYLMGVKDKIKERKETKKELQKEVMKKDLKEEIMREMEEEKEMEITNANGDMYPIYDKESDIMEIDKKFARLIRNKGSLTKKQIAEIKALKKKTEETMEILNKISKKLDSY
jgi:hypothetical protein